MTTAIYPAAAAADGCTVSVETLGPEHHDVEIYHEPQSVHYITDSTGYRVTATGTGGDATKPTDGKWYFVRFTVSRTYNGAESVLQTTENPTQVYRDSSDLGYDGVAVDYTHVWTTDGVETLRNELTTNGVVAVFRKWVAGTQLPLCDGDGNVLCEDGSVIYDAGHWHDG